MLFLYFLVVSTVSADLSNEAFVFQDALIKFSKPIVLDSLRANISSQCRLDSKIYKKDLKKMEIWALKMYDSNGKFPSGLLNGNVHVLGDYTMCTRSFKVHRSGHRIQGKYCQSSMYVEPTVSGTITEVVDLLYSHRQIRGNFDDDIHFFPSFTHLTWGFCVPASCSKEDFQNYATFLLKDYNYTSGLEIKLRIEDCATENTNTLVTMLAKPHMLIPFSILFIVLILCLLSTLHELIQQIVSIPKNFKILEAFSVSKNWKQLMEVPIEKDGLSCVHGLRFIFSMFIYVSHRNIFRMFEPVANRSEMVEAMESKFSMIFRSFWNHVDTFVIMSGLLTAYYGMKKLQDGRQLSILSMYLKRYIKFAPVFFVIIHAIHILAEFKEGPGMLRVMNHFVDGCRPSELWKSLLFISNFDGINKMCYPPAHQLLTDFQLYLMAPFVILYVHSCSSKQALNFFIGVIGFLSIFKAWVLYSNELGTVLYFGLSLQDMLKGANLIYLNPVHRAIPYICGLALGYYLRITKKTEMSMDRQNIGWCISAICAYYSFFGIPDAPYRTYQSELFKELIYGLAQPLTWSFTICWTVFMCSSGLAPHLNNLLSSKYFYIFSKIAYPFYMCQIYVIFFIISGTNSPVYTRITDMVDFNELLVIFMVSFVLYLGIMAPVGNMYKLLSNSGK